MLNIAVLSTSYNDNSGITEFSFDLIERLSQHCAIHYFSNDFCEYSKNNIKFRNFKNFEKHANSFKYIICHMGNCYDYHYWIYEVIKKYSCIVHLHDLVYQHFLLQYFKSIHGKYINNDYLNLLEDWYSFDNNKILKDLCIENLDSFISSSIVLDFPLFEEVIKNSEKIIIHSKFCFDKIKAKFPNKNLHIHKQLYNLNVSLNYQRKNKTIIGIFGSPAKHKCTDIALKILDRFDNISILICGMIDEHTYELINNYGTLKSKTTHTGYLSTNDFNNNLSKCDLIINLRKPTMGETSAIVTKALQFGIPVIVSNCGWYRELPKFILKVDNEDIENDLFNKIKYYLNNQSNILDQFNDFSKSYNSCTVKEYLDFVIS